VSFGALLARINILEVVRMRTASGAPLAAPLGGARAATAHASCKPLRGGEIVAEPSPARWRSSINAVHSAASVESDSVARAWEGGGGGGGGVGVCGCVCVRMCVCVCVC
jgi:hypothetical protein